MSAKSSDTLADEQAYFDNAREHRERRRHEVGDVASGMAHPRQAVAGVKHAEDVKAALGDPDDAVAIGRLDLLGDDAPIYVGKHLVTDENREPLVVSWKARIAAPYNKATVRNPLGVSRKRTFLCDKNNIQSFQDFVFAELSREVEELQRAGRPVVDDALLADLERGRTGEMQDIVRTIQASQFELMEADLDQILVVQGGPGTGKTVVALHRVSWLLYNYTEVLSPQDVLVVGPTKTFVRYIQQVLPSLGDDKVVQRDLTQLAPRVSLGRAESAEVERLKGELKLAAVLDRALVDRIVDPDADLEVRAHGRTLAVPRDPLIAKLQQLRASPYNVGRNQMREWLRAGLQADYGVIPPAEPLDQALNRIWPQLSAPAFLQELLGSQDRLVRAAGEDLTGREVGLLYRQAASRLGDEQWSSADVPLLDHVEAAMNGGSAERFRHVVVDEAQDLSPMQMASIARRVSHASMTLLGDIAQATGTWARESWDDLLEQLKQLTPGDGPAVVRELEYGYRVPAQVYELAEKLLPVIAPGITAPKVVRQGPADPAMFHEDVDDIAGRAAEQAREYAGRGYMVGVVCPEGRRADVEAAMRSRNMRWRDSVRDGLAAGINLMTPAVAKGLEFDAAVVAYPDEIVGGDLRVGGRLLYIAMTRCTQELSLVFAGDALGGALIAPEDLEAPPESSSSSSDGGLWSPPHEQTTLPVAVDRDQGSTSVGETGQTASARPLPSGAARIVQHVARQVAADVREVVRPDQMTQFLNLLREELGEVSEPDDG